MPTNEELIKLNKALELRIKALMMFNKTFIRVANLGMKFSDILITANLKRLKCYRWAGYLIGGSVIALGISVIGFDYVPPLKYLFAFDTIVLLGTFLKAESIHLNYILKKSDKYFKKELEMMKKETKTKPKEKKTKWAIN